MSSVDDVFTIVIQPGALEQTIELVIEERDDAPLADGPVYGVQPNIALLVPGEITYRHELPADTSQTAIVYLDAEDLDNGTGWHALDVVAIDEASGAVLSDIDRLHARYSLLE